MIDEPMTERLLPAMAELVTPMAGVATVMAGLLATVFLVAASVKLAAPTTTATQFERLGVPIPAVAARIVPAVELVLVPVLFIAPRAGAAASLVLLTAFTVVIVGAVRAGIDVSCGCLGSVSQEPVSPATVARNLVLVAMALAALPAPAPVIPDLAATVTATVLVLGAALIVQLLALQQRIGRVWSVELPGEAGLGPETPSGGNR